MFFGNEHLVKIFKNLAANNELGQAYIFFGDAQIGKFLFTQHLAYFLEYNEWQILPRLLIDAQIILPDEKGIIGIDTTIAVRHFLFQKPLRSKRRLVVINEADKLTPEAQASLLKIVEEPPTQALLIFVIQEPSFLLPPLLSRLTKVYFSRLSQKTIKEILQKHYHLNESRVQKIAEKSFGRIGRALALLSETENQTGDLSQEVEEKILFLWENKFKNFKILKELLERNSLIKRYNLNENLQRKAIKYLLQKNP